MTMIRHIRIIILIAAALHLPTTCVLRSAQVTSASREDGSELLQSAVWAYEGGFYESAQTALEDYIKRFPSSRLVPRARLLQAQTRFRLGDSDGALAILEEHQPADDEPLRDRYIYWKAEIAFLRGEYSRASGLYRQIVTEAPSSALVAEASFSQALSEFHLENYPEVIRLLQPRRFFFRSTGGGDSNDEFTLLGKLLLAEAFLLQRQHKDADDVLDQLESQTLSAEQMWRTSLLRARVQQVEGNLEAALALMPEVLENARAAEDPAFIADSLVLRAELLEALNRRTEAAATYEELLLDETPGAARRNAFLALIRLHQKNGEADAAISRMERFIDESPNDPLVQDVLVRARKLYQTQYELPGTTAEQGQDYLARIREHIGTLATATANPLTAAHAHSLVGWSSLKADRLDDARAAYQIAEEKAGVGTLRASATTRLAEIDYRQGKLQDALDRYRSILRTPSVVGTGSGILEHSRIESIRILVEQGQFDEAELMLIDLRSSNRRDTYVRGALLYAQGISRSGDPAAARAMLGEIETNFPESQFIPEVRLKIAEAHMDGGDWVEAREALDQWIAEFPDHALLAEVEFDQAWATAMAGNEDEALGLFEDFLTRRDHSSGAKAQFWIGNHHLQNGEFVDAEAAFQQVYTKWPTTELRHQARMMAGYAATERQAYTDAREYFGKLVENFLNSRTANANGGDTVPDDIAVDAFFAHADSFTLGATEETRDESFGNAIQTLNQLVNAFTQREQTFPQHPNALARMAECHRQINRREEATRLFREALALPSSDPDLRAQIKINLALALEDAARTLEPEPAEARNTEALTLLEKVYLGLPDGSSRPADAWMIKAGIELTRMLERRNSFERAASVYEQMLERFPSMTAELAPRLENVRGRSAEA